MLDCAQGVLQGEKPVLPVEVWGIPLSPITLWETLDRVDRRIEGGKPGFIITANLNWAMLATNNERLQSVQGKAAFIVADGMPLLWGARLKGRALPERVTGSDLVPALCSRAVSNKYRILLLGGAAGIAAEASERLRVSFPGLDISGTDAPLFRTLRSDQNQVLISEVQKIQPQILLVACSQPDGEVWLADNYASLGVPVCIQIGAAIDFAAGRVSRAPRWIQRAGLEWLYRLAENPLRLAPRYWRNALYMAVTPI